MRLLTLAAVALALAACSPPPPPDDAPDAEIDAPVPQDAPPPDVVGLDVAVDAGRDSAADAPADVATEASSDAAPDAPPWLDLAEIRSTERFEGSFRTVLMDRELTWDAQPSGSSCMVLGGGAVVVFTVTACARGVAGLCDTVTGHLRTSLPPPFPPPDAGPVDLPSAMSSGPSVPWRATPGGYYGPSYMDGAGRRRRNFLAQFAAEESTGFAAVLGIPGVTVDPIRGQLWLMGCAY